jgi:hypothetical protein
MEKFELLEDKQICDVGGVIQKHLHPINTKKLPEIVINLYLFKAYDMVSWLFLRLIVIHIGFGLSIVN